MGEELEKIITGLMGITLLTVLAAMAIGPGQYYLVEWMNFWKPRF